GNAFAAGQPGADQVPGVALIDLGTRRADALAAVAARGEQHPARLRAGVVHRAPLAGGPGDGVGAATPRGGVTAFVVPGAGVGGRPGPRAVVQAGGEGDRRGGYGRAPQRCWAAWRVTPSRAAMSAQE